MSRRSTRPSTSRNDAIKMENGVKEDDEDDIVEADGGGDLLKFEN